MVFHWLYYSSFFSRNIEIMTALEYPSPIEFAVGLRLIYWNSTLLKWSSTVRNISLLWRPNYWNYGRTCWFHASQNCGHSAVDILKLNLTNMVFHRSYYMSFGSRNMETTTALEAPRLVKFAVVLQLRYWNKTVLKWFSTGCITCCFTVEILEKNKRLH